MASPAWTDEFFAFGASVYSGLFTPRFLELISIAFDASITHMYAPGTRRHIQGALKAGATPEEIMAVLQICVSMGVQACAKGCRSLPRNWNAVHRARNRVNSFTGTTLDRWAACLHPRERFCMPDANHAGDGERRYR